MSQIKSFKKVLEIAIKDDSVKVIAMLDKVLTVDAKNKILDGIDSSKESKVANQIEIEFDSEDPRVNYSVINKIRFNDHSS
jgi:hypothetical protein